MAGPIVFVAFQVFLFGITNAQCPVECNDAKIFGAGEMCGSPPVNCEGTWHLKDPQSVNCPQEWPIGGGIEVPVCKYRRNKDGKYMCFCDPGDINYVEGQDWQGGLCYNDSNTPKLLTFLNNFPSQNNYYHCMHACIDANSSYTYFGLEEGIQCYCGFTEPSPPEQVSQLLCDKPCPGSPNTTCGGTNYIQVYAIPKRLPVWLGGGCYNNTNTPKLLNFYANSIENSYFHCMEACRSAPSAAYTYFGLEDGDECFCGYTPPPIPMHEQVWQLDCDTSCPGAPLTTCGGPNLIQVYAIPTA